MCYLIAKDIDNEGCVALRTPHGKSLCKSAYICTGTPSSEYVK